MCKRGTGVKGGGIWGNIRERGWRDKLGVENMNHFSYISFVLWVRLRREGIGGYIRGEGLGI